MNDNILDLLKKNLSEIFFLVFALTLQVLLLYPGSIQFYLSKFSHFSTVTEITRAVVWHHFSALVLFFIVPLLYILILKDKPNNYGLTPGDWKYGLKVIIIAGFIVTPFVYISSRSPSFKAEYPLTPYATFSAVNFLIYSLLYLPYYIGWEFLYRGFIQFYYEKRSGFVSALLIQTSMSTLVHWNKPAGEVFSAIFGGLFLGILAFRTRSIIWGLLFHWYLGIINSLFCAFF